MLVMLNLEAKFQICQISLLTTYSVILDHTVFKIIITGVFFLNLESIVNALYRLRITDQPFKSYAFTRVVRSQSTLQRLLRRQI
jgi:hypothetical protein